MNEPVRDAPSAPARRGFSGGAGARWVLDVLLRRRPVSPLRYLLVATASGFIPALVLASVAYGIARLLGFEFEPTVPPLAEHSPLMFAVAAVVVAPVVETAILVVMIMASRKISDRLWVAITPPSVIFAVAHALPEPTAPVAAVRFVVVVWIFMIFSLAYVVWARDRKRHGFLMAAGVHALNNAIVVLGAVTGRAREATEGLAAGRLPW